MMTDNSNRSDPAKKCYTLSISEVEIEKQDDIAAYLRNRTTISISVVEANTPKRVVIKK